YRTALPSARKAGARGQFPSFVRRSGSPARLNSDDTGRRYSSRVPSRSRMKITFEPSGATAGSLSPALSLGGAVSRRRCPVSTLMATSDGGESRLSLETIQLPPGDQESPLASGPTSAITFSAPPRAGLSISLAPLFGNTRRKAICTPSGDQAGAISGSGLSVN